MKQRLDNEEDQMYQQDRTPVAPQPPAAPSAQEFYLPLGGGTDPDFYVPEDRVHEPSRFSRWMHALPGFGRR
ncbi:MULTISPECIES: hypothetical protein [unclassified Arthrobacter]|uniref:hypothetical protein n=1 Tax=unclassified Arthrobacter TaxID=235627 RepID=UPI0035B27CF9